MTFQKPFFHIQGAQSVKIRQNLQISFCIITVLSHIYCLCEEVKIMLMKSLCSVCVCVWEVEHASSSFWTKWQIFGKFGGHHPDLIFYTFIYIVYVRKYCYYAKFDLETWQIDMYLFSSSFPSDYEFRWISMMYGNPTWQCICDTFRRITVCMGHVVV
jgi:hypothetical protein